MISAKVLGDHARRFWEQADSRIVRAAYYRVLIVLAVAAAVWHGYAATNSVVEVSAAHGPNSLDIDIDNVDLLRSVHAHPTLLSTLGWLHESWRGNRVPYYWRPLTMFAFWIENAVCGNHLARWVDVSIGLQAVFVVVLASFADRVVRSFHPAHCLTRASLVASILTVLVFTDALPPLHFLNANFAVTGMEVVLDNWKDQLEMWTGIAILASVIFSMDGRWKPALACAVAAVCFKENGWLAFSAPLLTSILRPGPAGAGRPAFDRRTAAAWIFTAAILIALRASAGWKVFRAPSASTGHFELVQYLHTVIDNCTATLATDMWPIALLGAVYAACVLTGRRRRGARAALCVAATGIVVGALALGLHCNAATSVTMILDPSTGLGTLVLCAGYAAVLILAFRDPTFWRRAAFLYLLVLVTAAPTLTVNQPNVHMLYLTNGVQCVLIGATLTAAACAVGRIVSARNPNPALRADPRTGA
ncbi:MAG: hypothetical protein ACLQVD_08095 [Capsulimonadaceae bacterium]